MLPIKIKLNEDFYKEEMRNGFLVTESIKELWAVELDLLVKFDSVCKKHNIKYYLYGGTLLGAIRHKGFIPWDDDIDVVIFREDYNKLIDIAESEFEEPYLLQSVYTDINYMRGHLQLRNKVTCMMLPEEAKVVEFNQGIFMDIFVLDGLEKDNHKLEKQIKKMNRLRSKMKKMICRQSKGCINQFLRKLKIWYIQKVYGDFISLYNKFSETAQLYSDSKDVEILMFRKKVKDCIRQEKHWYDQIIYTSFEGFEFPIPKDYKNILEAFYGRDYMVPQKVSTTHGRVVVSTRESYQEILKRFD